MRTSAIKKNHKVYIFKHQQTPSGGGGGGADLEDNKQVSITENGTVEITPSAGKDGMKKVTATVNVPSGGSATAYAWDFSEDGDPAGRAYFDFDVAPEDETEFNSKKRIRFNTTITISSNSMSVYDGYTKQSNTQFYMIQEGGIETVYTRADSSNDINIWEWVPTGGGGGEEEG